jgi:IS30 family transposase
VDTAKKAIAFLEDAAPFLRTAFTTDNGKEFANHEKIAERLRIDFCFAKPYDSWKSDANENLNGPVRQYSPGETNLADMDKQPVKVAKNILNNSPRKSDGFKSPNEVFAAAINNEGKVAFIP